MAAQGFAPSRYTSKGDGGLLLYVDAGILNGVYQPPFLASIPPNSTVAVYDLGTGSYQIATVTTGLVVTSGTKADAANNPQFSNAQFVAAFQQTPGIVSVVDART